MSSLLLSRGKKLANHRVKEEIRKSMRDSERMLKRLLEMVEKTEKQEMDCDEVFKVLDIYTEAMVRGDDITEMLSIVKNHLEICRCCSEEYEALKRVLESTDP